MIDEILKDAELRMNKSVEAVATEFLRIRTGRASTALLDHLTVDYYGSRVPIAQAATVSVGDARTLVIQAWEKGMIPLIEKAIIESDLGLNPVTAGEVMRIPMPALTEERRKEMTKIVRQEGEHGKIAVRNIRRDALGDLRDLTKEKLIGEDDEKRAEAQMQILTDRSVSRIDEKVNEKEAEVMDV
ncbi:ribosome recycling factor [Arenicellales bacterium nBUS_48]|jgi:ribosome recycling factor|nr:ribosome recycling factor [Pseudomonadota bacterium]